MLLGGQATSPCGPPFVHDETLSRDVTTSGLMKLGREVVLRITRISGQESLITLKIEGRIASECVAVLKRECVELLEDARRVRLDVAEVDFVDIDGVALLRELVARGVEFEKSSLTVEGLMTEVQHCSRRLK